MHPRLSAAVSTAVLVLAAAAPAQASVSQVAQVRGVYRSVLNAEYFGPSAAVCSHLTPAGIRSFTAGGAQSCRAAFAGQQRVLEHRTRGVDNSGYSPARWRRLVQTVMAHLQVRVTGSHATAVGGGSGIPGRSTLVNVGGRWRFTSSPPSVEP